MSVDIINAPASTKHLYNISTTSAQRLRRWSNIVQMLYKCFVFAEACMLKHENTNVSAKMVHTHYLIIAKIHQSEGEHEFSPLRWCVLEMIK